MHTTTGTYYSFSMIVRCPGWIGKVIRIRIISTNCIHTDVPHDDGPRYVRNI